MPCSGDSTILAGLRHAAGNRLLLLVLALIIGALGAKTAFISALTPPDVFEQQSHDHDVHMLRKGLDRAPTFRDTLSWWTGEWIGCNPFWRPLSSYAFWTMERILGWEHHDRFEMVRALCHVAATGMLFWFVATVSGRPLVGLLTVFLANLSLPGPHLDKLYTAWGLTAVYRWISLPDIWLAMVALPALWLAWRGSIWWAVPLTAAAAMIKETGFVVFPLVMLFYWWRQRKLHRAFWALLAIGAVMASVKLITVGPGWILGSNRAIWLRIFRFVAPKPVNYMVTAAAPWVVLGAAIAIAVILWRRPRLGLAALAMGLMASVLTYSLTIGWPAGRPGLDIAFAGVLEKRGLLKTVPIIAVWGIAAWAGFRGPYRGLIVLLVIAHYVLGLPPKIAPQTGTRSLYTAQLLSSAISALCVWSLPVLFGKAPDEAASDDSASSVNET